MQNDTAVLMQEAQQRARSESAAWSRLAGDADGTELCAGWLALLAGRVARTRAATLLIGGSELGPCTVAAVWPQSENNLQYPGPAAQSALSERRAGVPRSSWASASTSSRGGKKPGFRHGQETLLPMHWRIQRYGGHVGKICKAHAASHLGRDLWMKTQTIRSILTIGCVESTRRLRLNGALLA